MCVIATKLFVEDWNSSRANAILEMHEKRHIIIHDDRNVSVVRRTLCHVCGEKRRKGILQRLITSIHPRFRLNARSPDRRWCSDPDISHCHVYTYTRLSFIECDFFPSSLVLARSP